ncbi:hypothetical protein B0O99DRAFT_634716 [Bisporella sp. PMI_857]|nr:hypothetical protein B0O99DRAFT_634716 [Bisporella sp. PMI_857]
MAKKQKQNEERDSADGELMPGRVHWQSPTKMICCYIILVMLAAGHHLYYTRLDGQPATDQSWKTRAGIAFANVFQILFSISMGLAFAPQTWRTLRRNSLYLDDVGKLFTAPSNPLSILSTGLLKSAKISMLIAALAWISPLIPILAPASLSVVSRELKVVPALPIQINNFNFSQAANISNPEEVNIIEASTQTETDRFAKRGTDTLTEIHKLRRRQSSSSSSSSSSAESGRQDIGETYAAYTKPTNRLTALISEVVYGGQIVQAPSPCGENCTFTQSFVGPAYQCAEMDPYDTSSPWCSPAGLKNTGDTTCSEVWEVFGASLRSTLYEASNSSADFCTKLSSNPRACNSTFASTTEPWENGNIWVRYKYLAENWRAQFQENKSVPANAWMNLSYRCDQWDARFDLKRTYINSVQQVEVNTTFLNRTRYGVVVGESRTSGWVGSNKADYINFAIHQTLYGYLAGFIEYYGGLVSNGAELDGTALVENIPWPVDGVRKPKKNLGPLLEQLHANVTVSLLAMNGLVYFTPVAAPDLEINIFRNVFKYDKRALLLTYGLALLLGLLAIAIGIKSLFQNGVSADLGFLSILLTTRSRSLDDLAFGASLGADPISGKLRKQKVTFGATKYDLVMQNTDLVDKSGSSVNGAEVGADRPHAVFAVEGRDSFDDLKKGILYV